MRPLEAVPPGGEVEAVSRCLPDAGEWTCRKSQAGAGPFLSQERPQQAPHSRASSFTHWEVNRDGRVPVLGKS